MLPNPLHPAVVHFPVVLAFLLPIVAMGALWSIRRGARLRRAWSIPVALAGFLLVSSWVAEQTGEAQEDRVERVVTEQPLDTHEEAAEVFVVATTAVFLLFVLGLVPGLAGKWVRAFGVAGSLGLVAGAAVVGHSGGQLVYQHGAASAYVGTSARDASISRHDSDDDKR